MEADWAGWSCSRGPGVSRLRLEADRFHRRMVCKRAGQGEGGLWLRGVCSDLDGFRHLNLKRFALRRHLAVARVPWCPPRAVFFFFGVTLTLELCFKKSQSLSVAFQECPDLKSGSRTRVQTGIGIKR